MTLLSSLCASASSRILICMIDFDTICSASFIVMAGAAAAFATCLFCVGAAACFGAGGDERGACYAVWRPLTPAICAARFEAGRELGAVLPTFCN